MPRRTIGNRWINALRPGRQSRWLVNIRFSLLLLGLLAGSCRSDPASAPSSAPAGAGEDRLSVDVEGLHLRSAPGPQGPVVRALSPGTVLTDLGRVSRFTTRLTLQGLTMNEPWLYVRLEDGEEGWIYGGLLHFSRLPEEQRQDLLRRKRLAALLDESFADSLRTYRAAFADAPTDADLHQAYQLGQHLREAIVRELERQEPMQVGEEPADLFWLRDLFPGYLPQLVAEGTAYYFFADYGAWRRRAEATRGRADDEFFELCIAAFPEDSIEYFYPAWTIQTWDYGGHSLLGRGIHRELIRQIDRRLSAGGPFAANLQALADRLVDDITLPQNTYWEDTTLIIRELEGVLDDSLGCLSPRDRIAIEGRLEQFRDPEAYDLRVNLRAGEL